MLLRETIRKTKFFLHKTLRSLKSVMFGGYQKLPRSLSFNPFLGRSGNARTYTSDQFYNEFHDMLQSDLNRIKRSDSMIRSREQAMPDAANTETQKSIAEEGAVEEKKSKGNNELEKKECLNNSKSIKEGVHDLAQKMKELEMMDSGDVEHVLDIEEAIHYYSRLTSPVYLDIVDKFFMDMHSEFSVQESTISIAKRTKSKGRMGSIRL